MKKNPIIKRYVNAGWRVLAGNFKFSEALNFLCRAGRAVSSIAKRVGGCFVLFFSCGAWILKKSSLCFGKKYFTTDKERRGETELPYAPPTNIDFYESYIEKIKEFDKNCGLLLKKKLIDKKQYNQRRHWFALTESTCF
jgi:hypothetical protein